ncbi:hypothetical protein OA90_08455 [Labrenzia sp. OB1]|nr:hypothetical protein OA90_08455 [Labrenzia sp. OB1]
MSQRFLAGAIILQLAASSCVVDFLKSEQARDEIIQIVVRPTTGAAEAFPPAIKGAVDEV